MGSVAARLSRLETMVAAGLHFRDQVKLGRSVRGAIREPTLPVADRRKATHGDGCPSSMAHQAMAGDIQIQPEDA
jgi:hypothetical protein